MTPNLTCRLEMTRPVRLFLPPGSSEKKQGLTYLVVQTAALGIGQDDLYVLVHRLDKTTRSSDRSARPYQTFGSRSIKFRSSDRCTDGTDGRLTRARNERVQLPVCLSPYLWTSPFVMCIKVAPVLASTSMSTSTAHRGGRAGGIPRTGLQRTRGAW